MYILIIQSTYEQVEIAIYNNNSQTTDTFIAKQEASSKILIGINDLLHKCQITLQDIHKIIVNLGPSPFTTLRTVISTVNGLAFAMHIPVVGVDGLKALVNHDAKKFSDMPIIVVLNAFANDVYYAIKNTTSKNIETGITTIDDLLEKIGQLKNFYLAGNGYQLHKDKFTGDNFNIIDLSYPSIEAIFSESTGIEPQAQVLPMYLKAIKIY
jgi:tRNA threonylcarbamoyl adenosine modification protein YeaZ